MGMFDNFFGNNQQAAQQAAPTANPQVAPVVPDAGNLQDPNVVAQQGHVAQTTGIPPANDPSIPNKEDTPLADFSTLWDTHKTTETDIPDSPKPLDQAQVQELVAKQDFSSMITPEMLATVPAEQHEAFINSMNMVARNVMTQSTLVNNKLSNQAVEAAEARFAAKLPELLRAQAVTNHATENNPLLNNPAIKPVAEAARAQLLQQFPNASQAEITDMTQNYIKQMGEAFAPAPVESNASKEQDFSNYLAKGTAGN